MDQGVDADAAWDPRGALRPPGCQGPPLKAGHRQEGSPGKEDVGMMIMMMYKGNHMKKGNRRNMNENAD